MGHLPRGSLQLSLTYDTGGWSRLTTWGPVELDVTGNELSVAFGAGRGLWSNDTMGWRRLTPWDPEQSEAVNVN